MESLYILLARKTGRRSNGDEVLTVEFVLLPMTTGAATIGEEGDCASWPGRHRYKDDGISDDDAISRVEDGATAEERESCQANLAGMAVCESM